MAPISLNSSSLGIKRRASSFNTERIDHIYQDPHEKNPHFYLHYGDLTDSTNLIRIIQEVQPDAIYNLGVQSHVKVFFEVPECTSANAEGYKASGTDPKSQIISGIHIGDVRSGTVNTPEPLRCSQTVRLLDCKELPGILRDVCL